MSERQFAAASVGRGPPRRFAGLAEMLAFLTAYADGESEGADPNAEQQPAIGGVE